MNECRCIFTLIVLSLERTHKILQRRSWISLVAIYPPGNVVSLDKQRSWSLGFFVGIHGSFRGYNFRVCTSLNLRTPSRGNMESPASWVVDAWQRWASIFRFSRITQIANPLYALFERLRELNAYRVVQNLQICVGWSLIYIHDIPNSDHRFVK